MAQIREDHALTAATLEDTAHAKTGHTFGVSWRQGFRTGFWQAVEYVLTLQQSIDDLSAGELLAELRKGPGSIYWPVKADDPNFHADCPRCHVRVLIDREGICYQCGHEFQEQE
jgi:hypothetical protein